MPNASFTFKLGGPQPNSPTTVFHQGQAFFLAGNRCLLSIDVAPGVQQTLVSPGVVNLCLAIELFLKSIVIAGGSPPAKIHKLQQLFGAITGDHLDSIKVEYNQLISNPNFDELIAQISNYFVEVRYGYEFNVFSFSEFPVYTLAKILYSYAAKLHGIKTGIEVIQL